MSLQNFLSLSKSEVTVIENKVEASPDPYEKAPIRLPAMSSADLLERGYLMQEVIPPSLLADQLLFTI